MKQKQKEIDHGKTLYDSVIFMLLVLTLLWFLKL
jgi:hypothetical protein